MEKFFWFRVINVFFGGILASSFDQIGSQLISLGQSPIRIVPILGHAIPLQTNFFTNFVLVNGLIQAALLLLEPIGLIIFLIKRKLLTGNDPRSQATSWSPGEFTWIKTIPLHTFMFMIITVFSIISPLMLLVGLIFYLSHYFVDRNILLYRKVTRWESGGLLWPVAFNQLCVGMLFYCIVMLGIFIANVWVFGIVISVLCFIAILFYLYYMNYIYRPHAYYGSLYPRAIERQRHLINPETYAWDYQHGALKPIDSLETDIPPAGTPDDKSQHEMQDNFIRKKNSYT